MHISSEFDSGNIEVLDASTPGDIRLNIRADNESTHSQWFHFRVAGARDQALTLRLMNAASASYPKGWEGYRAVASYDRQRWFRVPTRYEGGVLSIEHTPAHDAIYYAYFAPYSLERHRDLVARCLCAPGCQLEVLGRTCDGRDLDLLQVGAPGPGKRVCWVIARQHPGESMAEWLMEGLLARLLDDQDPVARELLKRAVFYVVPNMNPDGSTRGHLRTNATGANLNREWAAPTLERSPEVYYVRERMAQTGVDAFLDVHGDEGLPYNFIAGPDGVAPLRPEVLTLQQEYMDALTRASPDFQTTYGYPRAAAGTANMTMATNHVAGAYQCLSMTLEQPFKDNANAPDAARGWSRERCRKLGAANLDALYAVIDRLR
jgi:murein tripeptide amidase MpaA